MSDTIFMHDSPIKSFDGIDQDGVTVDDDGIAEFQWDEVPIVAVDAPADLKGAFDTDRFYKIEGATIARPIKQVYHVGDDTETFKKPADELRRAAWSFDNAPFTLDHPSTGMVKDVNDVHGFWKNPRYRDDDDRLVEDLYIPVTDDRAREFVAENQDVSVGFFNRVHREYDGDTGDLTDEQDVDGYQVDIYGNHVAGVERGRCSSEEGCGLDSVHGRAVMASEPPTHEADGGTTSFLTKEDQTKQDDSDRQMERRETTDQPSGIKSEDGTWFAVGPGEHTKDSTDHPGDHMFPVDSCADIGDAWNLRGSAEDLNISEETLENRIIRAAEAKDCSDVPSTMEEQMDADCGCTPNDSTTMDDKLNFDLPALSVDALSEKHEGVRELTEQLDEYETAIDELREELDLEEDECPCDAVPDLKEDAERASDLAEDVEAIKEALGLDEVDDVTERVEDIADEWQEMRADKRDEKLDRLEDLGAKRDEWEDATFDALDEEIERREEIADAVVDTSPTGVDDSESGESGGDNGDEERTISGRRTFGRGHAAGR